MSVNTIVLTPSPHEERERGHKRKEREINVYRRMRVMERIEIHRDGLRRKGEIDRERARELGKRVGEMGV